MNVHITYKFHKTASLDKEINHSIEKLQKRLQAFRPELIHLKGCIEENSARKGFAVSLNLRLPSGQMAAHETAATALPAMKAAFEDLLQQLSKHKDLLRNVHKWHGRPPSGIRQKQVPFEQTFASLPPLTVSSDDVRSYINANLARLERFVNRELSFRQVSGDIRQGSLVREEVVDEVVARALGDGLEKPDRIALEPWLYRLSIRVIDELAAEDTNDISDIHLGEPARSPHIKGDDESRLQFHQPDENLTEENVIADQGTNTPEDIAYNDEMVALVELALRAAKRQDREVFILHAIEGFSVDEIATISDRKPEEVRRSIEAARDKLRKSPPIANRFKDELLRTGTA
ncbi:MAG TPA: sigma factor-like helix-turn-helix DNA-binding protein [Terriglobales bacterium]|nr:sigma factor-like helix-turn-helix DNA-binding protein [Terriglobales bacterium]